MLKRKMIDTHMHIEAWENEEFNFIDCFERHKADAGLTSVNICVVPTSQRCFCNNLMVAFYKLAHPDTYAHGAFDHIYYPITEKMPEGMDLVTQYHELMEIGFDGIKMIEGKPTALKPLGNNLNVPALDRVLDEMERDQTHIVFHINDPDYFWDKDRLDENTIKKGWWYGDGTYPTQEEIYKQADILFERHPRLRATLAHFFFCGENPSKLAEIFEKYPNLCVDLTPGCEMYHSFERHHAFYKSFFEKYSERILVGTDGTFPWLSHTHTWCFDILSRFITTDDKMMAFDDSILTGLKLSDKACENILYNNYVNRVSIKPKPINKQALRAYYDKYKHLIPKKDLCQLEPLYNKYLK